MSWFNLFFQLSRPFSFLHNLINFKRVLFVLIYCNCFLFLPFGTNRLSQKKSEYSIHLAVNFRSFTFEVLKVHHLGHDKALFKVCVDAASSLRCFGTFLSWNALFLIFKITQCAKNHLNRPCLDLVGPSGEEIDQLQAFVALDNNFIQRTVKNQKYWYSPCYLY